MEKIKKYKKIIIKVLESSTGYNSDSELSDVITQLIIDDKRNHFQLMSVGWEDRKFIHECYVHFDIIDGKIWLQRNMTERNFAKDLEELGVPKSDIVIGFLKPSLRGHTGYAAA